MHGRSNILWQQAFRTALDGSNPEKLQERVFDAEGAIVFRLQELYGSPDSIEEKRAQRLGQAESEVQS